MSDGDSSCDEDVKRNLNFKHSAELLLDLDTPEKAAVVCQALSVDKEPKRSNAVREIQQEGQFLRILIKSEDRRSLQKSTANLLDMCDLSMSTLDMILSKKWLNDHQKEKPKAEKNQTQQPSVKKLKLATSEHY